MATKFQEQT